MLKKEYELIMPFVKTPWKSFTFKQIKQISKKNSESYVYSTLKKFVAQNILNQEKIGNSILYKLNISNYKTQVYAGYLAEYTAWNLKYLPFDLLQEVMQKIPTSFFTFIITGSYAKNKQTKNSDIDIVIIVDDKIETKFVLAQIMSLCELSIPPGHPYIFKKSEFLQMILNNEANYGKEIVMNNLIFYGGAQYFNIIMEAINNGFNDTKLS